MTSAASFLKDPSSVLDYGVDWATRGWLATGETIIDSDWIVPTGLTKESETLSGGLAIVWLSGGVADRGYSVTNQITTSAGRVDQRTIEIRVRER
jgi:hypothetical protein